MTFANTARADFNIIWPLSRGGTGQGTQQAAINALAGANTSGYYLRGNGTNDIMSAIQAADVPTLNQNTTGTASTLTGALSANQILGSLTAVAPTGLTIPSCSTAASALLWTSGAGFSCNTSITAAAAPASGITGILSAAHGGTGIDSSASSGVGIWTSGTYSISSGQLARAPGFSAFYPATGQQCCYYVARYSGVISGWSIVMDTGTVTVQTWKVGAGTAAPNSGNSISTSGVQLSSNTAIESTNVTDFTTTTVTAGDIFAFNISALSGNPTKLTFQLNITAN